VQQDALDKIAGTASGVAILAVGHEGILRLYNWGKIRGLPVSLASRTGREPFWMDVWNGPAKLGAAQPACDPGEELALRTWTLLGAGSAGKCEFGQRVDSPYPALPDPLPEISPLILPPDMEPRRIASTQAGFEAMVKYAQASGSPLVQEMKKEIYEKLESMAPAGVAERVAAEHAAAQGVARPTLEPIQNSVVKRAKPVPPAPPPEKTSGEKRKEILKKANRQHHQARQ
jgi:hypothetical protein